MRNFVCESCSWEGYPSFDLTKSGKLASQCPKCQTVDPRFSPADFQQGAPVDAQRNPMPLVAIERPKAVPPKAQAPVLVASVGRQSAMSAPVNVVKLAKARLRDVERELKRMRLLEGERDELRRLLDAATRKPRIVRDPIPLKRG